MKLSLKEPKDLNEDLIASYIRGKHDSIKSEQDNKPIWNNLWEKETPPHSPTPQEPEKQII